MERSDSIQEEGQVGAPVYWFRVVARVGRVAYRLELPAELGQIHDTFHVSQLRKCIPDESAVVPLEDIQVDASLNYAERPVAIRDRKIKVLRNKEIPMVLVPVSYTHLTLPTILRV